nr:alpha/beta hydrolase [Pigmentibacter ruber]
MNSILPILSLIIASESVFFTYSDISHENAYENIMDFIARESVIPTYTNIPYANISESQKLDLYIPENINNNIPVIVFIHGGAFMFGSKTDPIANFKYYLDNGFAIASINYRLSGEAKFPAAVQDAKAAVRWLKANAEKLNFDASKIGVFGQSAGANIASLLGTTSGISLFDDPNLGNINFSSSVNAVTAMFPPVDFSSMDSMLEKVCDKSKFPENSPEKEFHNSENSPESLYLGKPIQTDLSLVKMANPVTYINENTPPFLIQVGDRDCIVGTEQSIYFYNELKNKIGDRNVTLHILKNAGHGDRIFDQKKNALKVIDFFKKHLK